VLASSDGAEAWGALSNTARAFPVHVWVADEPGSVCAWEGEGGIDDMKARPAAHKVHGPLWPARQNELPIGRGWPRLVAALRLAWRGRGVCAGGRSGRRLWAAVLVPGAAARLRGA
jgi:hypothetical protein